MGNGQKWELQVLFWPQTGVPKNYSGRECCWPYLIGQHPLSCIFCQTQRGAPYYWYFDQLPPVLGNCVFPSGELLEQTNTDHKKGLDAFSFFFKQLSEKFHPCDVEIDKSFPFFSNSFGANHFISICLGGAEKVSLGTVRLMITPARTTTRRTYNQMLTKKDMIAVRVASW